MSQAHKSNAYAPNVLVKPKNRSSQHRNRSSESTLKRNIFYGVSATPPKLLKLQNVSTNQQFPLHPESSSSHNPLARKRKFYPPHRSTSSRPQKTAPGILSHTSNSNSALPLANILNFEFLHVSPDQNNSTDSFGLLGSNSSPITTPMKFLIGSNDEVFDVQTPTKAINESDQQSFHLISPPSGFGYLGGRNNSSNFAFIKPRVLFSAKGRSTENELPASATPASETSIYSSRRPPNEPCILATASSTNPLQSLKPSSGDSIALSMAKMTVWNRKMTTSSSKAQQSVASALQCNFRVLQQADSTAHSIPPFPAQNEPQLSIRRILQIGFGESWRQVALAGSPTYADSVRLAYQCLGLSTSDSL